AGAALAVVAVGIGAWATLSGGPQAVAPVMPPATSSTYGGPPPVASPKPSGPTRYFYDDGKTELPAGPLRDAAEAYAKAGYQDDLAGMTVVTTFDPAMQKAAEAMTSPNDVGVAALDPKTGYVKALRGPWDRPVPVADTMKPIVLAAAFETGHYTPDSVEPVNADLHPIKWHPGDKDPLVYIDPETHTKRNWPPEHSNGFTQGDPHDTLSLATADAMNAPFAYLALSPDVGLAKVIATAVALGIPSGAPELRPVPSLILGTTEASPLTMASVYAAFADGGVRHDPVLVAAVKDPGGGTKWQPDTTGEQVVSQHTASEITNVLTGVLTSGTAAGRPEVRALGLRGMAAMPGTSDLDHAAWFDGYSPDLVTSVALSHVDAKGAPQTLIGGAGGTPVYGSTVIAPMWARFAGQFAH
ncbi:MAG: hypothetical protein HOW97_22675, partial [Catenulispora sp.]|nr:hypothetical protein [Catenulispora sp.]